jgi:hypothetical protein
MTADTSLRENPEHGNRIAAGMGKLQEVDLGPEAAARTQQAWKQLQGGLPEKESTAKVRLGRDGKPRRAPKRRNSDDVRRDQMVEAVLRESKRMPSSHISSTHLLKSCSGLLRRSTTRQPPLCWDR